MRIRRGVLACLLLLPLSAATGAGGESDPAPKPYLVALDFASPWDDGVLGRKTGKMFRSKATRRRLFSVDIEIDWDDKRAAMKRPSLDADPETVARKARDVFGCDVLVWGEIEKPNPDEKIVKQHDGHQTIVDSDKSRELILHVRALDMRTDEPRLVVRKTWPLKINFEITRKVDEVLKALTGAATGLDIQAADPANRMVPAGLNLVPGGDFEVSFEPIPHPSPWTVLEGWHFPMKEGITLDREVLVNAAVLRPAGSAGSGGKHPATVNRYLQYDMPKAVADLTGLFCYTPYVPIEPDTYYQVSFRIRTHRPKVIMFVKGYRDMKVKGYEGIETHRQEVFKHQKRFYGEKNVWETLASKPFLPRSARPEHMPQFLRVQLYAYHPAGRVAFDDVTVRKCIDPEAAKRTRAAELARVREEFENIPPKAPLEHIQKRMGRGGRPMPNDPPDASRHVFDFDGFFVIITTDATRNQPAMTGHAIVEDGLSVEARRAKTGEAWSRWVREHRPGGTD